MYTPIVPPKTTEELMLEHLRTLFGVRAQEICDSCSGKATVVIDMLRYKTGRGWAMLRAARGLHELALLEMAVERPSFSAPAATKQFLKHYLGTRPFESFLILHLDTRHKLIAVEELFRGTIDGAVVAPREILRSVIEHNSAAVVFSHGHPSGQCSPSLADELITKRLKDLLSQAEVRVLDHIIVAGDTCMSFAERGLL